MNAKRIIFFLFLFLSLSLGCSNQTDTLTPLLSPTKANTPKPTKTPMEMPTYIPESICSPLQTNPEVFNNDVSCGTADEWAVTPPFIIKLPLPPGRWFIGGKGENQGDYFCGEKEKSFHYGGDQYAIDINKDNDLDAGELVLSTAKGIAYVGRDNGRGNFVIILHGVFEGFCYISEYDHLQRHVVEKGQCVEQGDQIGNIGNTGEGANGKSHLHFVMRRISVDYITSCDAEGFKRGEWEDYEKPVRLDSFNGIEIKNATYIIIGSE